MDLKRLLQHLVIAAYIGITISGFSYTMWRYKVPGMPRLLWQFSYGMMAPFQGYEVVNYALVAEGKTEGGEWESIDLTQYLPYGEGERSYRSKFPSFTVRGEQMLGDAYVKFAFRIMQLERDRGRLWSAIRLAREEWPMSKHGYSAARKDFNIERIDYIQIP